MRKSYDTAFNVKGALEATKEQMTLQELAQKLFPAGRSFSDRAPSFSRSGQTRAVHSLTLIARPCNRGEKLSVRLRKLASASLR